MMFVKNLAILICSILFFFGSVDAAFCGFIEDEFQKMNIEFKEKKLKEGLFLAAIPEVVTKNAHDAAGAKATLQLSSEKFSDTLRRYYYLKNITNLCKLEASGEATKLFTAAMDYVEDMGDMGKLGYVGIDNVPKINSIILKFSPTAEQDPDFYRYLRERWGFHKNTTFLNLSNRLGKMTKRLDSMHKKLKNAKRAFTLGKTFMQYLLVSELEIALLQDRAEMIEKKINNDDPQFQSALATYKSQIAVEMDNWYEKALNSLEMMSYDGTLEDLIYQAVGGKVKILASKAALSIFAKKGSSLLKKSVVTYAAYEAVSELWHEFVEAPKNIIDHIILSTMVVKHVDFIDLNNFDFFNENILTYDSLVNAEVKAQLLHMFFSNLKVVMEDKGLLDSGLKWLNPVHYAELVFYGGEYIDRDLVIEQSDKLIAYIEDEIKGFSVYDSRIYLTALNESENCYPQNRVDDLIRFQMSMNFDEKNIKSVLWNVFRRQKDGGWAIVYNKSSGDGEALLRFNFPGDYSLYATMETVDGLLLQESMDFFVNEKNTGIEEIYFIPEKMSISVDQLGLENFRKINAFVRLSNGSTEKPNLFSSCSKFEFESLTPDLVSVLLSFPSSAILRGKKIGVGKIKASIQQNGVWHSGIIDVQITQTFIDVPNEKYYSDAILFLNEKGVAKGYEDGTFRPNQEINRAEFLKIVLESRGLVSNGPTPSARRYKEFRDVEEDDWYSDYVKNAYRAKFIDGYPDGTFRPFDSLKRCEGAKIIVNSLGFSLIKNLDSGFPDVLPHHWFHNYVSTCEELGIIKGFDDGFFRPGNLLTRGDACLIIYRAIMNKNQ